MRWPQFLPRMGLPTRTKATDTMVTPVRDRWHYLFRERAPGSWQKAITISQEEVRSHPTVFACMSLIANDIAKLRIDLESLTPDGIWVDVQNPAYSVLAKPNHYQDQGQFLETWVWSLLGAGNAYFLKQRDQRNVVTALYPLDPFRVIPMVSNDNNAQIFYQLLPDNLSGIGDTIVVPAREIIHSRWNCMHHPLVGTSPIYAAGLTAIQALEIQKKEVIFNRNGAMPSGILTAPGTIDPDVAKRLEDKWRQEFQGENAGSVAVLGSGLTYEILQMSAAASQVVDQLNWSSKQICSVFGVPEYKIGLGALPAGLNIQALQTEYFGRPVQRIVTIIECCLSQGLGLALTYRVTIEVEALLRMDSVAQMNMLGEGVQRGIFSPNEARAKFNLPPVPGGEYPYLQQQNYSLEALAKRDAQEDPFAPAGGSPGGGDPAAMLPPSAEPGYGGGDGQGQVDEGLSDSERTLFELLLTRGLGLSPIDREESTDE